VIELIYWSLGYSSGRFLGPSRPPIDLEKEVAADIEMMTHLATPARYLSQISAYLKSRDISFRPLNLPDTIVKKEIAYRASSGSDETFHYLSRRQLPKRR
jgi:hypothetical protein